MRPAKAARLPSARALLTGFTHIALLVGMLAGASKAQSPPDLPPAERIAPPRTTVPAEAEKLAAEIAKTQAETRALAAIGDQTRWWTTVLAAVGSLIGAIVGGIFTFVVTKMGQRFSRVQRQLEDSRSERDRLRREVDDRMSRLKMRQEREQAQELHNLRLFQDLGHHSHRARLAAAAVLLDRLRKLRIEPDEAATAELIGKVLVAVLKRQTPSIVTQTSDDAEPASAITAESEASLRKFIADEMVATLGVRFEPRDRPAEFGMSRLGEGRDFQKCDLADVYWAYVDARGIDFFQSDFTQASLRGAALQGAVFYEATLRSAIFRDADLRKANLIGSDLRGADFRDADLREANLQGADLLGANLKGADLTGAVISTEAILRFRPTALPHDIEASTGIRTSEDVYRPAS